MKIVKGTKEPDEPRWELYAAHDIFQTPEKNRQYFLSKKSSRIHFKDQPHVHAEFPIVKALLL